MFVLYSPVLFSFFKLLNKLWIFARSVRWLQVIRRLVRMVHCITVLLVEVSSLAGVWLKLWTWQGGSAPLMTAGAAMPSKHMVANQKLKLMDFMAGIGTLHQST